MKTIQKQLLGRMIAMALAIGVALPVVAQERPRGERDEQHQRGQDEVRRVGRSPQAREDGEPQAAQPRAAQAQSETQGQGRGQDFKPEQRPNPRALEVRQSEEAHGRNAQRDAQRDDGRLQRQPQQGRLLQEPQRDRNREQQQLRVEQDRTQVPRRSDGRRFEEFNPRNGGVVDQQQVPPRRGSDQRNAVQRDGGQWGNEEERGGRNNPRETPALREAARLPERDRQHLISQQRQSVDQYRRDSFANQGAHRQHTAALQQQNRMQQSRYQQRYWQRQYDMQSRWSSQRFDYDTHPHFYTRASYRYQRGGRYYEVNRYAAEMLQQAINFGYEEGVRAGEADRYDGWHGGYRDNYAYIDANFGYEGYYVSQRDYNHYFREGFRRGYEDGFGRQYRYGHYGNGEYFLQPSVLSLILRLEPFG